ncbi:hypothetical protein [Arthrobacter mangrovi]|uniref:Uncharacterized protein n=1 Tax=Arthrobacter mangrovi TaxID=2966350 RepID=A0ABQ5MZD7_9MICC|nr:hypothetical protein [Arthrobacter mangrovi]GLB69308.1 hypothetical protein AHIS1636_37510 [Arthrobacter mangrovi]
MCYASNKDFGWRFRKEAAGKPEKRDTDDEIRVESWTAADDTTVQAFLDKATAGEEETASDRTP